jgi:hypothetical protein
MGQLDVHIRHGGGGPDLGGLIYVAIAVVIAVVAEFVLSIIVWLAVAVGVALVLALALLTWWLLTQPARKARFAETYRQADELARETKRREALERHQRALELARASAPVIQNVIDPSAIAAALAGAQLQHPAGVVRGEVER